MKDMHYVLENFFTHRDYLVPASQIPGTIFTPLHFIFAATLAALIFSFAFWISRREERIRPALTAVWVVMVVWEFVIVYWNSVSGKTAAFDFVTDLPLYPCSIYLYIMPCILWGRGRLHQIGCAWMCTVGMLGAVINFLLPLTKLIDYSCISFAGFHTFFFHGSMLLTYLVLMFSGWHRYDQVGGLTDLLLPCIPSLLLSIPANIVNYSIGADYMFFRGQLPLMANLFRNTKPPVITMILYILYIVVPALFYVPAYVHRRRCEEGESFPFLPAE